LRESWCGEKAFPVSLGKNAVEYLRQLHGKLQVAKTYATSHTEREQKRNVSHYNLRSQDKHFECGERVLILTPDSSSSRLFSKWTGPATVVEVRSPYSYTVELDGVRHVNTSTPISYANFMRVLIMLNVLRYLTNLIGIQ